MRSRKGEDGEERARWWTGDGGKGVRSGGRGEKEACAGDFGDLGAGYHEE